MNFIVWCAFNQKFESKGKFDSSSNIHWEVAKGMKQPTDSVPVFMTRNFWVSGLPGYFNEKEKCSPSNKRVVLAEYSIWESQINWKLWRLIHISFSKTTFSLKIEKNFSNVSRFEPANHRFRAILLGRPRFVSSCFLEIENLQFCGSPWFQEEKFSWKVCLSLGILIQKPWTSEEIARMTLICKWEFQIDLKIGSRVIRCSFHLKW